jgi:ribosomal protein S18 acetylase RimI-like enzyme
MIKITKAEKCRVPDILKLWEEFMEYSANIDASFTVRTDVVSKVERKLLRPFMKSKNHLVLVALDNEKVVGYSFSQIIYTLILAKYRKIGIIHDLFITNSHRRKGIGEKMYNEILNWFHSQGIKRIELQVIVKNQAAVSFWKKLGYKEIQHTLFKQI